MRSSRPSTQRQTGGNAGRACVWPLLAWLTLSGCQLALGFEDFDEGAAGSPPGAGAGGSAGQGGAGGSDGTGGGEPLAARALSAGSSFTCALRAEGPLCWGNNGSGQIGVAPSGPQLVPQPVDDGVDGPLGEALQIETGASFACAIAGAESRLFCWGENLMGQLGNNTFETPSLFGPVLVTADAPFAGAQGLSLGYDHSCAWTLGGEALCWGTNSSGQVGNGQGPAFFGTAQPVVKFDDNPLAGVVDIAVGGAHACALLDGGRMACWGANDRGQLGIGAPEATSSKAVSAFDAAGSELAGVKQMALGDSHTCALLEDGGVLCWGSNAFGQLGNNAQNVGPNPVPVVVFGLPP